MQHALDCDASEWVLNSPDKAPAFNLAEAGFDVWMGNNRGCRLSMKHIKYDPSKKSDRPLFWNFDFEDMGIKDLPTMIDFVLEKTGQQKVGFVGHSEGTTQTFIGMSMMPEYFQQKINLFVALAPPTRISNSQSTLMRLIAKDVNLIEHVLVDVVGLYNMFPHNMLIDDLAGEFCSLMTPICAAFLELFADLDASVDNLDRMKTYLSNVPAGASYRNFVHYAQIMNSDRFQRYDWGKQVNM
jgi:pimeloyl-ACP methyl ester carboxylesterase